MKRKLMSIMLAVVMLFGIIPFGSVAARAENEPGEEYHKQRVAHCYSASGRNKQRRCKASGRADERGLFRGFNALAVRA